MITLDIQPYCEDCPAFEADVVKHKTEVFGDYKTVSIEQETTIYCKRRKTCEGIKNIWKKKRRKVIYHDTRRTRSGHH